MFLPFSSSGEAAIERWQSKGSPPTDGSSLSPDLDGLLLPLAVVRGKKVFPMDESVIFRPGDRLYTAITEDRREEIEAWLRRTGWGYDRDAPQGPRTGTKIA